MQQVQILRSPQGLLFTLGGAARRPPQSGAVGGRCYPWWWLDGQSLPPASMESRGQPQTKMATSLLLPAPTWYWEASGYWGFRPPPPPPALMEFGVQGSPVLFWSSIFLQDLAFYPDLLSSSLSPDLKPFLVSSSNVFSSGDIEDLLRRTC